jgi:hypothetical protein
MGRGKGGPTWQLPGPAPAARPAARPATGQRVHAAQPGCGTEGGRTALLVTALLVV